jgi:hypothetical protein
LLAGLKRGVHLSIAVLALSVAILATLPGVTQAQGAAPMKDVQGPNHDADAASPAAEPSGSVLVHRATVENISANSTYLDEELINDNPDAVLYVTQIWNPGGGAGTYNEHPIGVWYDANRKGWAIFNQDREPMPEGAAFNVVVWRSLTEARFGFGDPGTEPAAGAAGSATEPASRSAEPQREVPRGESTPERATRPDPDRADEILVLSARLAKNAMSAVSSTAAAIAEFLSEDAYAHRWLLGIVLFALNLGLLLSVAQLVGHKWPRRLRVEESSGRGVDHEDGAAAGGNRSRHVGIYALVRRRRGRIRREQLPPKGLKLVTGAHNPNVRRLLGHPRSPTPQVPGSRHRKMAVAPKTRTANGGR